MQSQHWLRVRLVMPRWIPNDIEQRDWDLLCKQPQQQRQKQQQQQQQEEKEGREGSAAQGAPAEEVESDAGGVLADVFEEALDAVEALWDAADG
jgi:hypothetical protein